MLPLLQQLIYARQKAMMSFRLKKVLILLSFVLIMIQSLPCQSFEFQNQGNCYSCFQNCQSCINNISCLTCKSGSYLSNNTCLKCSVQNCQTCPGNVCQSCQNNFMLIKKNCQASQSSDNSKLIILSVSLILCFIIGLIIFCLIHHNYCNEKNKRIMNNEIRINPVEVLQINKASQSAIIDFNWKAIQQGNKKINHDECSICLDHKTNIQLQCKHNFHLQCIGMWFQNHKICPICKKQDLNRGTLYCRKCMNQYIAINVSGLSHIKQCKLLCHNCQLEDINNNLSDNILKYQIQKNES